jgi:aminoglycoside phosphotransferase (APT) family kinase protein
MAAEHETADLGFDPQRLEAYLRGRFPDLREPVSLTRIAGGQSNPTFFASWPGRRLVLRKKPSGPILPSAHAVEREFRVQAALAGSRVPVAPMLLLETDESVIGTPFYLMQRVEGRVFPDSALPSLSPEERRRAYVSTAETLAALHGVDPDAVGLSDYGKAENFLARQVARWKRQWEMSKIAENADMEAAIAWLEGNLPAGQPRASIVHGDFRIGNLMFEAERPEVAAVFDWELSTLGDPLLDVAHVCAFTYWLSPEEFGGVMGARLDGIPDRDEFVALYAERTGIAPKTFHVVLALFRAAVIFEGIAARAKQGNAAADDAAKVGALSAPLARRALAAIEQG